MREVSIFVNATTRVLAVRNAQQEVLQMLGIAEMPIDWRCRAIKSNVKDEWEVFVRLSDTNADKVEQTLAREFEELGK